MENYTMLIGAFAILIFLGLMHRSSENVFANERERKRDKQRQKENFGLQEPPHLLRRLGLSPPYCPFRDQF